MILLQKAIENKKLDWKSNPADETEAEIREAQLTVGEITENQFLSNLMKEILRNHMPSGYYMKIAGMILRRCYKKYQKFGKNVVLMRSHSNIENKDS